MEPEKASAPELEREIQQLEERLKSDLPEQQRAELFSLYQIKKQQLNNSRNGNKFGKLDN